MAEPWRTPADDDAWPPATPCACGHPYREHPGGRECMSCQLCPWFALEYGEGKTWGQEARDSAFGLVVAVAFVVALGLCVGAIVLLG